MLEGRDHEPDPGGEDGHGGEECSCTWDYQRGDPEVEEAGAVPEAAEGFSPGWDHGEPAMAAAEGAARALGVSSSSLVIRTLPSPVKLSLTLLLHEKCINHNIQVVMVSCKWSFASSVSTSV